MSAIQQLMMSFGAAAQGLSVPSWATGAMAYAISGDGSRVMGIANDPASGSKAWVWSSSIGHGESPAVVNAEWVFSTDASSAAAVSMAEGVFSVEMWDGETHRSFSLSGAADATVRAISSNGNHVAASIDGVPRIYSGVTGYIASGAGLTYRDLTPPAGYDYPNVFHISDAGDAYSTIYSTSLDVVHIGRAASADTVLSAVFDTYGCERYLPARDGADAVVFGNTTNLKLYNPTDGIVDIGDDITERGFVGSSSVIYGNKKVGTAYMPGVWSDTGGWTFTDSSESSSSSSAVSAPDQSVIGMRFLFLIAPGMLRIFDPVRYSEISESSAPLPTVPGDPVTILAYSIIASADLSLIFFTYTQGSESYSGAYRDGLFVQMGVVA